MQVARFGCGVSGPWKSLLVHHLSFCDCHVRDGADVEDGGGVHWLNFLDVQGPEHSRKGESIDVTFSLAVVCPRAVTLQTRVELIRFVLGRSQERQCQDTLLFWPLAAGLGSVLEPTGFEV